MKAIEQRLRRLERSVNVPVIVAVTSPDEIEQATRARADSRRPLMVVCTGVPRSSSFEGAPS